MVRALIRSERTITAPISDHALLNGRYVKNLARPTLAVLQATAATLEDDEGEPRDVFVTTVPKLEVMKTQIRLRITTEEFH